MCIAILNTKQTTLKKQVLKNCWENNGDGAGMLYIDNDNKLQVFKEMKDFNTFYNKYIDVRSKYGKRNIVLHFRISTHGRVNETNCHPFLVNDNIGFVHNGMIYDVPTSTEFSDTYMFNESILKNFKDGFEYNETMLDMLETFIGGGSKLVFLNDNDDYFIVNEKAGHWSLGCWFSNSSYKQVNDWYDFGGIKKQKTGYKTTAKATTPTFDRTFHWSDNLQTSNEHTHYCHNCDIMLYGINEIEAGMCEWCKDEIYALESTEGDCASCEVNVGKYNGYWDEFICEGCTKELGA